MKLRSTSILSILAICAASLSAAEPETLKLWPGAAPDATPPKGPEHVMQDSKNTEIVRVTDVSEPSIQVFHPSGEKRNSAAVLICPGGGYHILAITHEGTQVAEWLNGLGVTAVVLKYRTPSGEGKPAHLQPLQDAQRAMSVIRDHAEEWKINPARIGILGFSAGGNLGAWALLEGNRRAYQVSELKDEKPCRPDFGLLIYPAYLTDAKHPHPAIRPEEKPGETFFAHADDDKISSEGSAQLYLDLKKAGISSELHIYAGGGHGFGMLKKGNPVNEWPQRAADWMQSRGFLK